MERQSGIYKIQSKIKPERIYIGSAVNITKRWSNHLCYLKKNTHHSIKLQNHFNKYGIDDLMFSIIEPCLPDWLIVREQYYMDNLKPKFNVRAIAESCLGNRHSEESKKKMKENAIKNKIGNRFPHTKGVKCSKETKQLLREANLGKHHSAETRRKMSEARKGHKYNLGIKLTEEHKNKIRQGMLNAKIKRPPISDETKAKKRENILKNKLWERNRGRIKSAEEKQKIRDGLLRYYQLKEVQNNTLTQESPLCN